jgi:toxin ParE1/3/4
MSRRVVKSDLALADLEEQAEFIRRSSPTSALRFLNEAEATFLRLATIPGLGEPFEAGNPSLRGLRRTSISGFRNHVVYYQPRDEAIVVVRVIHAARDIGPIFGMADEPGG